MCQVVPSCFSRVCLFATLWTLACQVPLSMGLSKQEYWRSLAMISRDLPEPGIKPTSLISPALTGIFVTTSATWEAHLTHKEIKYREVKCLFPGLMSGKAKDWQRIWIWKFSLWSFHHVLLRKEKMKTEKTDGAPVMIPRHRKLLNKPLGQLFLGENQGQLGSNKNDLFL